MRVKRGYASRRRHKKILKAAKGFRGRRKSAYKLARDAVFRSWQFAYRDRRNKKRTFRRLWITRINAAARINGLTYSRLIHGMGKAGIGIDRRILADLAVNEPDAFAEVASLSQKAINS